MNNFEIGSYEFYEYDILIKVFKVVLTKNAD